MRKAPGWSIARRVVACAVVAALFSVLAAVPAGAAAINKSVEPARAAGAGRFAKDRILARFKHGISGTESARKAHARLGGATKRRLTVVDGLEVVALPPGLSVENAIARYEAMPEVLYAEPDYELSIAAPVTPSDPSFGLQWGLNNTGQSVNNTSGTADADIDAPEAWSIATGSHSVVVAVIDTGAAYAHPDLVGNMWHNPGEIPGNGIDDDGNGYIDDVYGIDTANHDSDPVDDNGHGTHCAGIIGAQGNNAIGVSGVNWDVSIMPIKAFTANGTSY